MARRLIERETTDLASVAEVGPALQRVCARLSGNLRRFVGDDGYGALLARALSRTESEQPVLKDMRTTHDGEAV